MDQGETVVIPKATSNPWGKTPDVAPCSLMSVMDEQLAKDLQDKEDDAFKLNSLHVDLPGIDSNNPDVDSDLLLAQMLQSQFDKENDHMVNIYEQKYNGNSKVSLSFDNYKSIHSIIKDDSSCDELDEHDDLDTLPPPDHGMDTKASKTKTTKKKITTKHDALLCGRKNARSLEKFPPGFAAGDVGSKKLDLKLSNSVYNTLKQHSYREERQSHRLHEKKEHSTHEQALDPKTRLLLYKMVNNETLDNVNGCISTGKEACVFHANGGRKESGEELPTECAIKVFKTTLNEFRTRERYIKDDHRFRDRFSKQNPRKVIRLWAEKEMCNLSRMQKAGISCPSVVLLKKHILVMSFVGRDMKAAPKLKDAVLSSNQMKLAYEQTVEMMCTMYQRCKLVHADLSEYNILWHDNRAWFIDVSQAVEPIHPHALEFLYRDCTNVTEFFKKRGVPDVMSASQLFLKVSELDIPLCDDENHFLSKVHGYERYEMTVGGRKNCQPYEFDYFFNKTTNGGSSSDDSTDE
ncbi:serine/threonine-protein kinase RIO3 [Exaiptasia diaphana]|uniref:Serine/threonine-protein kinase RIO3 n=1 Tax=Exaiptasia diaphana TaxID=2652724 RepID=A0A913WWX1_EXADI|nr:serine/threonine-protein kinase RIO3 [Exaiptasia diaphana]KXJ27641.1 Serine/threonine-protein kinase RIO3 [Exaiptasia diaphana]